VNDDTICLTDLMATCAVVLGVDLPEGAGPDSYDISHAWRAEASGGSQRSERPIREATVHHSAAGMFAIRQGPWKLILGLGSGGFTGPRTVEPTPGGPQGQLYNLTDDPAETTNVYLQHPVVVERLGTLLEDCRASD
jgi:hypothetical protein